MTSAPDERAVRPTSFPPLDLSADRDVGRLLVTCPDQPGICAALCSRLYDAGANITGLQQHTTDPQGGRFFVRIEFLLPGLPDRVEDLESGVAGLAGRYGMQWRLARAAAVKHLAIMVSTADHALQELLWRRKAGDLRAEIAMVVSNHEDLRDVVATWGIPFHHVPVTPATKSAAERRQLHLLRGVDTLVLARYMQVLTPDFLAAFPGQVINIHHSFLPAFVGADPYGRAAERGVKLIGATAHYVTAELDAGPIIEQDVARVDHRQTVADLRAAGRYVERAVLARAVSWHVEDRIIVDGNKTIVFA